MATYFTHCAIVDAHRVYFVWFTNDLDGMLFDRTQLVTFDSIGACRDYCAARHLEVESEHGSPVDLDAVAVWIDNAQEAPLDPEALFDAWNLVEDFLRSRSPEGEKYPLAEYGLTEKLFWALNLPVVTPVGERFDPEWSPDERQRIAAALGTPIAEFRAALTA